MKTSTDMNTCEPVVKHYSWRSRRRILFGLAVSILAISIMPSAFGMDYDSDFAALPKRATYLLVYAANSEVCTTVQHALSENRQGKRPSIYTTLNWRPFKTGQLGSEEAWFVSLPWQDNGVKATNVDKNASAQSSSAEKVLYALRQFFVMRGDGQNQALTILIDSAKEVDLPRDLSDRGVVLDGGDLYPLKALTTNQFPAKHFGVRDKRLAESDREQMYANFFDLVKIEDRIYVTFRSHNVVDLKIDPSYREWLVIAALPDQLPPKKWPKLADMLTDVCYFVRKK